VNSQVCIAGQLLANSW